MSTDITFATPTDSADKVTDNMAHLPSTQPLLATHSKNKPSALIYEADIVLKTRIARYYFYRGGLPNGTGVIYFTKLVRSIWQAAAKDDPYADLFLLRIYDALVSIRRDIQQQITHYNQLIDQKTRLKWKPAECANPSQIHLYFKLAYGYRAAEIIAEFDHYVNLIVSAKRYGILLEAPVHELIEPMGEKIRHALDLPKQWQEINVTRDDIRQQNELAQQAQTLMGALNPQILAGTLRAPDAPLNKKLKPMNNN